MFRKLLILFPLALTASHAWSFPFDVDEKLGDAKIAIQTMDLGDNMGAVTLENYGQTPAQCTVRFRSGPAVPVVRKAKVESGQKANVTASFNHQVIRMRVTVNCQPVKK